MTNRALSIIGTAALIPCLQIVLPMATASAHGYVSSPTSRQAQCAQRIVQCGAIQYEPQSVEGAKGLRSCNAGLSQFADLNDDSKPWRPTPVGNTASFTWANTALHRTAGWEYYIGTTKIASFDGNNAPPGATVSHTVNLSGFSGRQKLLAIWNIGDTPNAFYSCVDLQIGGQASSTTTTPTTTTPSATTSNPPGAAKPWAVGATYAVGDTVSYNGKTYQCLQAHTVYDPNWTPTGAPALWKEM
ncbi:cellulose-binding protein [Mycobacterium simiae]|uniref:Cellulose-binding protein n=2 Tax=Mycobacterium simiae TaxID=1784 RepID=A0A5B1BC01_MYCSI|nr:cellulose-binding protein [Mycobacterium simiae]